MENNMEIILLVLVSAFVLLSVIFETSSIIVYGWLVSEKNLDYFLGKHLESYIANEFSKRTMLSGYQRGLPYISKMPPTPLSKYHIDNHGRIPRWSKWTKKIDEKIETEFGKILPESSSLTDF